MARLSLPDRFRRRPSAGAGESGPPTPARAQRLPAAGALRRERRALVRTREERIRDLGGLMLEMYRRDQFRQDLLVEQCLEVMVVEERLREIDELLEATVTARRRNSASAARAARRSSGAPISAPTAAGPSAPSPSSHVRTAVRRSPPTRSSARTAAHPSRKPRARSRKPTTTARRRCTRRSARATPGRLGSGCPAARAARRAAAGTTR